MAEGPAAGGGATAGGGAAGPAGAAAASALPGSPFPLGATIRRDGTNFAVASGVADRVDLCLFDEAGAETTRVSLRDFDAGVWHGFLPGIGAGQAYGYRVTGPYDPSRGLRCNPAKLLLDPYARALHGTVTPGPEILGYAAPGSDTPSATDSAARVPRSLVAAEAFEWTDGDRPAYRYEDTIIYEAHV
ncbi:MAG: glycogen debranching enzyme, partial [Pseudonocardiales bacterium]